MFRYEKTKILSQRKHLTITHIFFQLNSKIFRVRWKNMNEYKPTVGIEPTDKYEKAKQDLLQAKQSFSKLNAQEQQKLIYDLFEAEIAERFIINIQNFR